MSCSRCSADATQVIAGQMQSGKRIDDYRCASHRELASSVGALVIYLPTGTRYRVLGTSEIAQQTEIAYQS